MKNKMLKLILAGLCMMLAQVGLAYGENTIQYQTSGVRPGYWTSDFAAAKEYAEKNHVPMIMVWGSKQCQWCSRFKRQAINSPEFEAWLKTRPAVLLCVDALDTSALTEEKIFAKGDNPSGQYPYVRIYWPKAGESDTSVCFTGRKDSIPGSGSSTITRFMSVLTKYLSSWDGQVAPGTTTQPGYDFSGEFIVPDTDKARLEYIPGRIESVVVPLVRTNDVVGVATNVFKAGSAPAQTIVWAAGEKRKYVTVSTVGATDDIEMSLSYKGAVHSTSKVFAAEDPGNSTHNPAWIGEPFDFGEWTMDLDAALKKTKAAYGDAATMVFVTGALWCPWCLGIENTVMDTEEFRSFMKEKQVSLVLLDNLKRSKSDSTSAEPYAFSTVANGAAPSLLSYDVGSNGASGASYLSRKGITPDEAAEALQRNHTLGYPGGAYNAPETLRTGYPTVIILDKAGKVRGRLVYQSDTSKGRDENGAYSFDKDENMGRIKRLVALAKNDIVDESSKNVTTTSLKHSFGDKTSVKLALSENSSVYRLEGFSGRRATFKVDADTASAGVTLSVMKQETVGVAKKGSEGETLETIVFPRGKTLATGKGALSYTFPATGAYYLKVASYTDASSKFYGDEGVETTVTFHSEAMPQAAGNPYVSVATSASIPVFNTAGGWTSAVGSLSFTATAAGRVWVKYVREARAGSVVLTGSWSEVNYDGVAVAELVNGAVSVRLNMDSTGSVSAAVTDPAYGGTLTSGESLVNPSFSPFKGYYTVALPVLDDTGSANGTGYAIIKAGTAMAMRNGKVTCQLFFPDGRTASASATLEELPDGWAGLTVNKKSGANSISLSMKIRPNAGSAPSHRAVIARDDVSATWTHTQAGNTFTTRLGVFGAIYNKAETLLDVSGSDELTIGYDTSVFPGSPSHGGIIHIAGQEESLYVSANRLTLLTRISGYSVSTTRSTGVVRGKTRITFECGHVLSAAYRGVIVPNWNDCGCFDPDMTIPLTTELPFVAGSMYYKESVGGKMVTFSVPFGFMPEE